MVGAKLFVRRRDGRIEVRVNDFGRSILRRAFENVLAAERDPEHEWHVVLSGPIDPSLDQDNPLAVLKRQNETSTNAELAGLSVEEQFLNESEAWAWLTTLQVALRSTAHVKGLLSDEHLTTCDPEVLDYVQSLQQFLFQLAECF